MANFAYFNPFSKFFLAKTDKDRETEQQILQNAQGVSELDELDYYDRFDAVPDLGPGGEAFVAPIHFSQLFQHKKHRISTYRQMSLFPEVSEALDIVADDAIVEDAKGKIVRLNFKKELHASMQRKLQNEFNYLIEEVFKPERIYSFYKKWLIEGELFLELVLNKDGNNIIGIKPLAAFKTRPIYKGNIIVGFAQLKTEDDGSGQPVQYLNPEDDLVAFPRAQIAYSCWDLYGFGKDKTDVRGYLEPAVRTYNQLRNLEDAVIVYRLVRAPERRVWNIEVGKMPTGKAEEHIKKLIHKYKKQVNYNTHTGAIDSSMNVQAMTEDFWFAQRDGSGSRIDTIGGAMNLGELTDIEYFLTKLQKVLKMPKDRFQDASAQYSSGRNMEREEVRFGKFIDRTLNRFKAIFMDAFIQQLKFKNFPTEVINRALYDFKFTESNYFKEFKKSELIESKMNIWSTMSSFVTSPQEPNAPFSEEFVMREWMNMTDAEIAANIKFKAKEKKMAEEAALDQARLTGELEKETAKASGMPQDGAEDGVEEAPKEELKEDQKEKPKEEKSV